MKKKRTWRFANMVWIPNMTNLKRNILGEAHESRYSIHPGSTKMYQDLKNYWWPNMKIKITDWVSKCLTCQKVKAGNHRPSGLLQPLEIQEWKWEHITMDFIVGLPKTRANHDAIWVIIEWWTISTHFLSISEKCTLERLVKVYINKVVLVSNVSDRDARITSRFWQAFQEYFGTKRNLSTVYHP